MVDFLEGRGVRARGRWAAARAAVAVAALGATVLVPASAQAQPVAAGASHAVAVQAEPAPTSRFVPLAPARVLDTRSGVGAPAGRPSVGAVVDLQVTGRGGVPVDDVAAVTLNLVVTDPPRAGYVQALPAGRGEPGASSNVNVQAAGQTAANLVTVPVGDGGRVSLYDVAGGHLVADVLGYFTATAASADGRYQAVAPTRVLDSRDRTGLPPVPPPPGPTVPANPGNSVSCTAFGTWAAANDWFWRYHPYYGDVARLDGDGDLIPCESLPGAPRTPVRPPAPPAPAPFDPTPRPAAGEVLSLQVTGRAGVPAGGVSAVAMTVTATDSAGAGFVQVVPGDGRTTLGSTSNLNLTGAGQTAANLVLVPVGPDGGVRLYTSSGTDVIADVVGWFTDTTAAVSDAGLFVPVTPDRLLDTRSGPAPGAGSRTPLHPLGAAGVPTDGVAAVFLNATATQTAGAGYLQLFPTGAGAPGASSSVNYTGAGQTVATAVLAGTGADGTVTVYTPTSTHVVVDVSGYVTAGTGTPPDLLAGLVVAAAGAPVAYDRSAWVHWTDDDRDCQDTRAEVLIAESVTPVVLGASGCTVAAGTWVDPYSGTTWTVPSDLDVDHVVPLKNAHDSGGWAWDAETRRAYANDLTYAGHLAAVEDGLNQSKGAQGPEAWKPPAVGHWCTYATDWATIKTRWGLTVTASERAALAEMLATC